MAFGSDSTQATQDLQTKIDTHSKALVSIVERQKNLESKVDIADDKIELLDHNVIKEVKSINQDIKHLRDEIHDVKDELEIIKEFQSKVKKQFKIMTTKDEVQKLERYIDLWNPMQFATHDQLLETKDKIISSITTEIEKFLMGDIEEKSSNKEDKKNSNNQSEKKEN